MTLLSVRLGALLLLLSIPLNVFAESLQTASARKGMVVTEQRTASEVGLAILRAGGNAVDSAVATAYALAVVNPCCGNIGGGGFMIIHLADGRNTVINFREKAPLRATPDMYLDKSAHVIRGSTTKGYLAVAVPGTVAGLDMALKKYGTMTRAEVMAPAISLAKNGYPVTAFDARWFAAYANSFRNQQNVASIFLNQGRTYQAGEILVQRDLANTLELIAEKGRDAFYKGTIAQAIVAASNRHGGILTLQDFAAYEAEELAPVICSYRGYDIYSVPPPSSGGVILCEALGILQHLSLTTEGFHSAQNTQYIIETMRYSFHDRNTLLGDPDFVNNPVSRMMAQNRLTSLADTIRSTRLVVPDNKMIEFHENTDTTHFSIMDQFGNAVAFTYTLNGFFGAKVIADHTGFFLNDEMDDFTVKSGSANKFELVQSQANDILPGKRPLSSMTPVIIMKNGKVFMVLGSPGGPRIITAVLLTILNVIDFGMNIKQAVDTPRFHFQAIPDIVDMEPFALSFLVRSILMYRGYHIVTQAPWAAVEAILVNPDNGMLYGANDDRRPDGAALGF